MTGRRSKAQAPVGLLDGFARGLVAAGLLAAVQDRWSGAPPASARKILRLAVQGGAALAAGIATAESLRRRDYAGTAVALAGGAVLMVAAERLLPPDPVPKCPTKE